MKNKDQQISALIELNDELENYFGNTIIPQLFVDSNLRLRKFTPPAMKQFKLDKSDLGKSIEDIKDNFRYPSIIEEYTARHQHGRDFGKRNPDDGFAVVSDEHFAIQGDQGEHNQWGNHHFCGHHPAYPGPSGTGKTCSRT